MATLVDYLRLHKETTYNTRPGSPTFKDLRVLNFEAAPDFQIRLQRDFSHRVAPTTIVPEGKIVNIGTFDIEARADELGEVLEMAHGQVTNTLVGTTARTLDFDPVDDPTTALPSYGADLGLDKAREFRASGVSCSSYRLTKDGAAPLQCAFTLIGADLKHAALASFTPSLSSLDPLSTAVAADTKFRTQQLTPISMTFEYTNGFTLHTPHTSRTATKVLLGKFNAVCTLTVLYGDTGVDQIVQDSIDEAANSTGLFLYKLQGAQIESGHNYEISIDMAKVKVMPATVTKRSEDEPQTVDLRFECVEPASGNLCRVQLKSEETAPS